ncbi:glucokinase [Novosphingobium sp. JCM 18896]|uniref:glucokinase n=1 Tax=Novosphingobium sp. JCM 18896 TaxID=2989731 RepID=UPI002221FF22|nr:glucokinase [Novosphingobium sp. JCM 18896]MCW1429577.1 glucokinase [Novosphingobium sp. JCM 18896]
MTRIVVGDIGGTNARFALAEIAQGRIVSLGEPVILPTKDHAGLPSAWHAYGEQLGEPLPRLASLAIAGPVTGGPVDFKNSDWVVYPDTLEQDLGLDHVLLLNDFGAMAHAVHALGAEHFVHVCGPDVSLPDHGAISVLGPGTGLGVAVLQRTAAGPIVLETEGSHIHFAPLDETEQRVSAVLSAKYGRTSVERVVSGPGLGDVVRALSPGESRNDAALWEAAIGREEAVLIEALDLFLASYGAATGDLSLAHGAMGVALTGGLTNRLLHLIPESGFHARFCDKARYRARMETVPIKLVTHPQPGLFGAAAAFAREHASA